MSLSDIIENIKFQNTNKKVLFANPADKRVFAAIQELMIQGHQPAICGTTTELKMYNRIQIEQFENTTNDDNNVYAAKLVHQGKVDAMISGNISPTGDVVKALIKNIGTKENISRLSSHFLMQTQLGLFLVADAAIQANPDNRQLAEIALLTARAAVQYGIEPRIAMLSFSTDGSASHEMVTKVQEATVIAESLLKAHNIDAIIEGELQLDSAVVPEIALLKNPNSILKGNANILIFPDLNSGNIGYKLMQRFGGAQAIGPIIQGLNKPGNDLSRGCNLEDILDLYYITANS